MSIYFYLAYISHERDNFHWATVILSENCSQNDYNANELGTARSYLGAIEISYIHSFFLSPTSLGYIYY